MRDPNCIFCKIIARELPSSILLEDDGALAFLDIAPFEEGHALVVPKYHAERLTDLPPDWLLRTMPLVQRTAQLLCDALPCDGFNILQSNGACALQEVPHVHFHIIPRRHGRAPSWKAGSYRSPEEMKALAQRLSTFYA